MKTQLLFILFSLLLFSCAKEETPASPFLTVDKTILQYQSNMVTEELSFETNIESWEVFSDQPWCLVSKSLDHSPQVTIHLTKNENTSVRSATISIKAATFTHDIKVDQLGSDPIILLDKDTLLVTDEAIERSLIVTSNVTYEVIVTDTSKWIEVIKPTRASDHTYTINILENTSYEKREGTVLFKSTDLLAPELQSILTITQHSKEISSDDVVVEDDIKIVPSSGEANQFQPGQGIENTFDGYFLTDNKAPYHSPWGEGTKLPVILEYFFDQQPEQIDYLIYHTRQGNGNFGKVSIYASTKEVPDYTLCGNYDFKMANTPSKVSFPDGLKDVKAIKLVVNSGAGGYASCDEMEFYQSKKAGKLEQQLLTVFTDLTCSELLPNITQQQIESLPSYFAIIGHKLLSNTYESEFRIHNYPAYSIVEEWAQRLQTKKYGILDNTTGIYAEADEEIVVLVGDTHGHDISMLSIVDSQVSGDSYFLKSGINKIKIKNTGILYIMYHTDITQSNAKPIKVHIPMGSGVVNGYFDLAEHKTDAKYAELLSKSSYKYFSIKGKSIMMTFHVNRLKQFVPDGILKTVEFWDNVVDWQLSLMGLEDIRPTKMNNRMYARSGEEEGLYMSATDYRTNYHENILFKILVPETMMAEKDNMWGPAHEIGHVNQQAINWPGCTESSNNLFSNFVVQKLGKFCSRGASLERINELRVLQDTPFTGFVSYNDKGEQNELTEEHMRMNWQLFTYFHRAEYDTSFFPKLFKLMRENPPVESQLAESQLNFVKRCSEAAKLDLTDFFEFWGFFVPVNMPISQYGTWQLNVTKAAIDETKAWVKAKKYRKPAHVIQYIEDRNQNDLGNQDNVGDVGKWIQYKNNQRILKTIKYNRTGNAIQIENGDEAVGFELKLGGKLIYFSNHLNFTLPDGLWNDDVLIYAVQADGKRFQL